MQCLTPILLGKNKVPCGKCNFCLQSKRADWSFRLANELKRAKTASFLTLTYDEDNLPYKDVYGPDGEYLETVSTLDKRDVQSFKKRLRKFNSEVVDWPLRYYTVGEYGTETMRPHYHTILYNCHFKVLQKIPEIWGKGQVKLGTVTPASIHYVTKYVINRAMDYGGREPPVGLMSKRPGLGADYLRTHTQWHRADMKNYGKVNGINTRLPRYYRDRIFNEEERAILALESLAMASEARSEELQRLCDLHEDAYRHYVERVQHMHDAVTSKINEHNTF